MTYKLLIVLFGLSVAALWTLKILRAIRRKEENMDPYQEEHKKDEEALR